MTSILKATWQLIGSDPKGRDANRAEHDFYRTSPEAVLPLLLVESFPGVVWEPACGDGAISELLIKHGIEEVFATDLIDRGYLSGTGNVGPQWDFMKCEWPSFEIDHVITNPPYSLAVEFALRVLKEDRLPTGGKLALFCRTLWLEGSRRHDRLFGPYPPSRVWTHRRRVPMARGANAPMQTGLISFSWFIWEKGWDRPTQLGWL